MGEFKKVFALKPYFPPTLFRVGGVRILSLHFPPLLVMLFCILLATSNLSYSSMQVSM